MKTLAIIGGGLAGLAAGIAAQQSGWNSTIYEHAPHAGGVAAWWKRQDYLIDGGIHFLMGYREGQSLYDFYKDLGIFDGNTFIPMTMYGCFIDEASGTRIEITDHLDQLKQDLLNQFPSDHELIETLMRGVERMRRSPMLTQFGFQKPPELSSMIDYLKMGWGMRGSFTLFGGIYAQSVRQFASRAESPILRKFLESVFLPEVPVWFILMVLGLLAEHQMAYIKGGCQAFVQALVKRYESLGGHVKLNATVDEIMITDHRATGIRLQDNTTIQVDAVIAAGDAFNTHVKLLSGKYMSHAIKERFETWSLCRPSVVVSLGVQRTLEHDPIFSMVSLQDPFLANDQEVRDIAVRILNYSDQFAPYGRSVIQVMFEAAWEPWFRLHATRERYEAEKERIGRECVSRLNRMYPGLKEVVEVTDVMTPLTTWRYTLNWKGAHMGWMMTSKQMMTSIKRTLPGLKGCVLAGQWVAGGGVPTSLLSGRHAVEILNRANR